MKDIIEAKLKEMLESGTAEGRAIAELMYDIKTQESMSWEQIAAHLVAVANEFKDWAQSFMDTIYTAQGKGGRYRMTLKSKYYGVEAMRPVSLTDVLTQARVLFETVEDEKADDTGAFHRQVIIEKM